MPNVFASSHPLVAHKLGRLRDKDTDPKRFRELVREIAALLAYEATADLATVPRKIHTPLGTASGLDLKEKIGLVPILRAGLGMVEGIWDLMPSAEVWHIGLYRDERTLKPVEYYNKLPIEPTVSVCLILDPMLATGGSAAATSGGRDPPPVQVRHVYRAEQSAPHPTQGSHPSLPAPPAGG